VRGKKVLVLKAGNCFREQVLDACPEISHADGSLHEGHSIETVRCMVASGYGISVLPAGTLGGIYRSDMVVLIPFEEPAPSPGARASRGRRPSRPSSRPWPDRQPELPDHSAAVKLGADGTVGRLAPRGSMLKCGLLASNCLPCVSSALSKSPVSASNSASTG
jgi:DNA-binding transcriptional LysR family regulator